MENNEFQFQKNILISGKIVIETGLHIGGRNESIDIGGVDLGVIRDPISGLPLIPGSSLKGKMRSLLELSREDGNPVSEEPCKCGDCYICKVFGVGAREEKAQKGPTRLIVRDAFPDGDTSSIWNQLDNIFSGAEIKTENWINRITSEANPRSFERVPKGSEFDFEMMYSIYSSEDIDLFKTVFQGMKLLEDYYLGGMGSRGYGKIKFENIKIIARDLGYYKNGEDEKPIDLADIISQNDDKLKQILKNWNTLKEKIS
ncbi:MAG: type III-A CRISPR-associated RAMP protein Csm3 [Methanosarcinales archaeon]